MILFEKKYREENKFSSQNMKTFISDLKRNYGICAECKIQNNSNGSQSQCMIDIERRWKLCVVCKINGLAHNKNLPICNECNDKLYINNKESFFKMLFVPLCQGLSKRHPDIRLLCDTAFYPGTNQTRPDAVIRFQICRECNGIVHTYKCVIIIEKDEHQHKGVEENDREKITKLVLDETHDYIFVIRLNPNEYKIDDGADNTCEPPSLDRHIVLRCWVIWYIHEIKQQTFPRYLHLYLYYSQTKAKLEKLMFNGNVEKYCGLGFGYGAPEHKDKSKNYLYSLEPTEGEDIKDNKNYKNYKETWGKHLLSHRQSLDDVFKKYELFNLCKDWKIDNYRKVLGF